MLTDKLFLQKVSKALDEKDFELTLCKWRIESLEAELNRLQRIKRRRVKPDPNTQFANIKSIRAAQRAVGRNPVKDSDSEEEEESSDVESYIQVLWIDRFFRCSVKGGGCGACSSACSASGGVSLQGARTYVSR